MKTILLTGGLGFIGSHTAVELLKENYIVHILDNLSNSFLEVLENIKSIVPSKQKNIHFHYVDLCDQDNLSKVFESIEFVDAVIHFAGLKAVKESVDNPILYYSNNLISTINLLKIMKQYHCQTLLFSSSATVYGASQPPLTEKSETGKGITNPYGRTKYFIEEMLRDEKNSDPNWKIIFLRYFNPTGAHPSGILGENSSGIPNNLMPYVVKVANGELSNVQVFGNDYETKDGSGVRDYIHVVDLAKGHTSALNFCWEKKSPFLEIFNLGDGVGTSVLEMIETMKKVSGQPLPYEITDRRDGDLPIVYCDPKKARESLDWKTERNVVDMCKDLWNYKVKQSSMSKK
jgi:UDP-glucose 4-epimerase